MSRRDRVDGPRHVVNSRDVARLAGVSQSTVSRVLNQNVHVRPETRARIEQAMAELSYIPNAAARSLYTNRTRLLGLVVSNITNAFYPEVVESITSAAFERGFTVIVGSAQEDAERQGEYLRLLAEQRVEGAILTSVLQGGADAIRPLLRSGLHLVLVNRVIDDLAVDSVAVDNVEAGRLVTSHLLSHGRARLAYVGGRSNARTDVDRYAGFCTALDHAGIAVDDRLIVHEDFTRASGYASTLRLLDRGVSFDALVAGDDTVALGCLDALSERGMRVPIDVAVAGFDDIADASLRAIWLTTVSSSAGAMGRRAVDLLLDRISGGYEGPPRRIVLPTELVVRGSCGHGASA